MKEASFDNPFTIFKALKLKKIFQAKNVKEKKKPSIRGDQHTLVVV